MNNVELKAIINFIIKEHHPIKRVFKIFKPHSTDKNSWNDYRELFLKLEEIKKIYTIGKKFYKKNRKASRKGDRFTQLLYLKLILTNLDLSKTYNLDEEIKKSTEFIKKHHSRQSLLKFKEELDLSLKKYRFCSKCGGVLELKGLHNNLINPENILKCKICKNWKKIEK